MERYLKLLSENEQKNGNMQHFVLELIRQITFDASLSSKERTDEIKKIYWALDEYAGVK
ncbi:hypothetical protein [Aneurinibacillus migulanus]|uniref:Uncharacterized protein n=1 Tax=Aneurinibacillus migulanus TaxID=47500 RepID=A0A1G8HVT0_ANEMI|nr:hypothetical protein [Aneurinibacillus migulanus]MCP1354490.1 hypothetical protein [Aneurinibacillus migulanus]MED0891586.1 hypothetical protein [Aneurinibacillus migulanus]MED1613725.1 hypothetical protein [Aneurinibacillus migulanus]MED4728997.1 hypothetical protein [Aneurinibacillus migulanus]SDI10724.1 hypothetical protein SAMN04487909_101569 [Aneurinibacillus migulanus]